MKFAAERPWSDPEKAARKLLEIANDVEGRARPDLHRVDRGSRLLRKCFSRCGITSHRRCSAFQDGNRALAPTETGGLSFTRSYPSSLLKIIVFWSATLSSFAAQADFVQTNLVSDIQRVCGNY